MKPLAVKLVPIFLCPLHVAPCEKRPSILTVATLENCDAVPPEPSPGRKDLTPSVSPHRQVLEPLNYLHGPPLKPLQCVSFELWWPKLDTVLQVQPDKHWVERDDHISISANNDLVNAAQDTICLCCYSNALLTPVQLVVQAGPPGPFQQGSFPATQILACTGLFSCVVPAAEPCTCLCWTTYSSCLPTLPACLGISVRCLALLTCLPHHSV